MGEIVTAGCAGIYPTGERSFAMLCGDGTLGTVKLDPAGRQLSVGSSEPFFDAVEDPVMMAGVRDGARWIFVSFAGRVHELDTARTPPEASSWSLVGESDAGDGWRPGGKQNLAVHRASQRLYAVVPLPPVDPWQ